MMPNILVMPFPLQGHINPFLTLVKLLIPHGFTFTFVITEELAGSLPKIPNAGQEKHEEEEGEGEGESEPIPPPPIRYVSLPVISLDEAARRVGNNGSLRLQHLEIVKSMRPGLEDLLRSLVSGHSGVSCIIGDCYVTWLIEVALQFEVPMFTFFTTNSHVMSTFLHIEELAACGASPISDPQQIIDFIPGLPPIQAAHLPESATTEPSFIRNVIGALVDKTSGIIFNTVHELERESLDAISQKIPVYPIGPMLLMLSLTRQTIVRDTISLWTEDRECLTWLDAAPPSSVLFVAFGSLANLSPDQLKELAEGLEASGRPFLWVIRPDVLKGRPFSSVLPEGFLERTKDRGLIISWAPQLEVLSHPSVGGFLTHCGWNSITENLSTGCIPMLCWPQIAEQRLNARIVVDNWRVGLEIKVEYGNIVKASAIERVVVELMQGDTGKEIKKRTLVLKDVVAQCVQEGGSSQHYLRSLVENLKGRVKSYKF